MTSYDIESTALGRRITAVVQFTIRNAFEVFLVGLIIYLCMARGLTFSIDMYDPIETNAQPQSAELNMGNAFTNAGLAIANAYTWLTTSTTTVGTTPQETTVAIDSKHSGFNEVAQTDDPAPHISNLTLVLSPDYGKRKGLSEKIIAGKKARVQNYLDRYAEAARTEMKEHGIPASITLAQGLLESNAGDSRLARQSNNHFGIKCRTKCLGCTCRNYGDDTRYDMFRVFDSPAESFREHSKLLGYKRYRKLKSYGKDYKRWAQGLQSCGYATDKSYAKKLIKIIENLDLAKYDA